MPFLYLGAVALIVGAVAAFLLAKSRRSASLLIGAAAVLAAALFAIAWLRAPASPDDADYSCSDCGMWVGRWWEGWLVLFLLVVNFAAWCLGVAIGSAMRWAVGARRELREQRGPIPGPH